MCDDRLPNEDEVVSYFLELDKHVDTDNNVYVIIAKDELRKSKIPSIKAISTKDDSAREHLVSQMLVLQEKGLISVVSHDATIDTTLEHSLRAVLKKGVYTYFDDKRATKIANRNSWIQFWVPVAISFSALVVSIIALVL